jgi:hypothetical protein
MSATTSPPSEKVVDPWFGCGPSVRPNVEDGTQIK